MARKKRVRHSRKSRSVKASPKNKIKIVFNNFLLFVALSLVSLVFFRIINNVLLINLFFVMAIVFGFVAVALLVALLVLWIMKSVKK